MCGIAGIFSEHLQAEPLRALAQRMGDALAARGPDAQGVWCDAAEGIALAHRRLSIIDLSPEGHQPMVSPSGRYVVSYNGELYNDQALREQLGTVWRGHSDTEVLLAAFDRWGVEPTLAEINGMFALALWDRHTQLLTLARDRMGEKPLYYGWVGEAFVFASELKAFQTVPQWPPTMDREALHLLMRYSYIPAPHSIYTGVLKLMPGTYLQLRRGQRDAACIPYWSLETLVANSVAQRFAGTRAEAAEAVSAQMHAVVGKRMISDVPLGVFLSGGIDSTAVAACMQAQSAQRVKSFTIGFAESGFDEAPYARAVAQHLGTEHHELYVSASDAMAVIPRLATIYDEPFADASQIPTCLLAAFAREHVVVAVSGDGGDELFGGYRRHRYAPRLWALLSVVPWKLRRSMVVALRQHAATFGAPSAAVFYDHICATYAASPSCVVGAEDASQTGAQDMALPYAEWMMLRDAQTYFPGDILTKLDRAAMAVGLETRTPFTDPDLMALAWCLPLAMKLHAGQGKWPLRQLVRRYVPDALMARPKAGFAVPIAAWLRGPLKPWAADLLAVDRLRAQGLFHAAPIQALWQQHQSGQRDHSKTLWNMLMAQHWLDAAKAKPNTL